MIKEIMNNKIINANSSFSFKDISKLMKENNIGFIPIKDNDDYIGVITDRDICLALTNINDTNDNIKPYITNNIIYINISDSIDDALSIMSKYKIKRLLVKDNNKVIGILSLSDILNYTNNNNLINTYKAIFFIHDNHNLEHIEIDEFYL